MRQSIYCCFTISNNQSAGTQLHTSEIADDDNENIRQFRLRDLSKDRLASRRRWFTIIIGTKLGALRTQHIGITTMSGIVIFLTVPGNNLLHLVNGRHVVSKGEKLTPLFGVISLAYCIWYSLEFVNHIFYIEHWTGNFFLWTWNFELWTLWLAFFY